MNSTYRPTKRRRVMTRNIVQLFLDTEAIEDGQDDGDEGVDDDLDDFINDNDEDDVERRGTSLWRAAEKTSDHTSLRVLACVAEKIERRITEISIEPHVEKIGPRDGLESHPLAMMPSIDSPPLWRVKVSEGCEDYTISVINDRLNIQPHLAFVAFSSYIRGYIAIKSEQFNHVQELCRDISTISQSHPPSLIPLEERVSWLVRLSSVNRTVCPTWLRLRKPLSTAKGEVKHLRKYNGDLALAVVHRPSSLTSIPYLVDELIDILLVPRLPDTSPQLPPNANPRIGLKSSSAPPNRHLVQKLLHPDAWLEGQKPMGDTMTTRENILSDSQYTWIPPKRPSFTQECNGKWYLCADTFCFPFQIFERLPLTWFEPTVVPCRTELDLFSMGLSIVSDEGFPFNVPRLKQFVDNSYDVHLAAPLEPGEHVDIIHGAQQGSRGKVIYVLFDQCVIDLDSPSLPGLVVPTEYVRRCFVVGDPVQVSDRQSNFFRRVAFVVGTNASVVELVDVETKAPMSLQRWQLIPHNPVIFYHQPLAKVPPHHLQERTTKDPQGQLKGEYVVIAGKNMDKGLRGRIRDIASQGWCDVEIESGAAVRRVHVNHLVSQQESQLTQFHWELPPDNEQPLQTPPSSSQSSSPTSHLPTNQTEDVSNPDLHSQGTLLPKEVQASSSSASSSSYHLSHPPEVNTDQVLPADWPSSPALCDKRIWVYVHNSKPHETTSGWMNGDYEGERGMTIAASASAPSLHASSVEVHFGRGQKGHQHVFVVPSYFLCPEMPTRKGQKVVALQGEHTGRVFNTQSIDENESNSDSLVFTLVLAGKNRGRAFPVVTLPAHALARCDFCIR